MQIKNFKQVAKGTLGVTMWDLQTMTPTTVSLPYAPEGIGASEVDKFFVGGVTLDSSNLETELAAGRAFQAGVNNGNNSATSLALSGLSPGQWYSVIGRRYGSDGNPVSPEVWSNRELVVTQRDSLYEFDAESTLVFDPAVDSFYDWFYPARDGQLMGVHRGSDVDMGDYVRIQNLGDYTTGEMAYAMFDGLKFMSSRWDWSMKFKIRLHGTGGAQQLKCGFTSGDQCAIGFEGYRAKPLTSGAEDNWFWGSQSDWPNFSNWNEYDAIADMQHASESIAYHVGGFLMTCYTEYPPPDGGYNASKAWVIRPKKNNPPTYTRPDNKDDLWSTQDATPYTVEYIYTKSNDTLIVKLNDVTIMTVGSVQALVSKRRKWPTDEEYPFPIAPYIRLQLMSPDDYYDIGSIEMSSSCPYDLATFLACSGEEQSRNGVPDWVNPKMFSSTGLNAMAWLNANELFTTGFRNRFTTRLHSGYTLPPITGEYGGGPGYFENDWGSTWNQDQLGTFKILPVASRNRTLRKLRWSGYQYLGYVKGQIVNHANDAALQAGSQHTITDRLGQATIDAPAVALPTNIAPEVEIKYTGTAGQINQDPHYSPSKFLGVELYFGRSRAAYSNGQLTFKSWPGSTIHYGLNDDPSSTNQIILGANETEATISVTEDDVSVRFYASEGSYTEAADNSLNFSGSDPRIYREDSGGQAITRRDAQGQEVIRRAPWKT